MDLLRGHKDFLSQLGSFLSFGRSTLDQTLLYVGPRHGCCFPACTLDLSPFGWHCIESLPSRVRPWGAPGSCTEKRNALHPNSPAATTLQFLQKHFLTKPWITLFRWREIDWTNLIRNINHGPLSPQTANLRYNFNAACQDEWNGSHGIVTLSSGEPGEGQKIVSGMNQNAEKAEGWRTRSASQSDSLPREVGSYQPILGIAFGKDQGTFELWGRRFGSDGLE